MNVDRMGRYALGADILFGVAIAGAVTGVVWLLLSGDEELSEDGPPVSAMCDSHSCQMSVQIAY